MNLLVSGNPYSLLWGGELGSAWDINATQNWTNQLNSPDFFFDNDAVLFNDLSANPNVTLDVPVQPGQVTVSNNLVDYIISSPSGTGSITGPGGLTKAGTATLTLSSSNTFTGPVAINAGKVVAGAVSALGGKIGRAHV